MYVYVTNSLLLIGLTFTGQVFGAVRVPRRASQLAISADERHQLLKHTLRLLLLYVHVYVYDYTTLHSTPYLLVIIVVEHVVARVLDDGQLVAEQCIVVRRVELLQDQALGFLQMREADSGIFL